MRIPPILKYTLIIMTAIIFIAVYFLIDPSTSPFMPKCLFRLLTGWECPGCGTQRALHALLHGNLRQAWSQNPILLILLPYFGLAAWSNLGSSPLRHRIHTFLNSAPFILLIILLLLAWTLFRNLS